MKTNHLLLKCKNHRSKLILQPAKSRLSKESNEYQIDWNSESNRIITGVLDRQKCQMQIQKEKWLWLKSKRLTNPNWSIRFELMNCFAKRNVGSIFIFRFCLQASRFDRKRSKQMLEFNHANQQSHQAIANASFSLLSNKEFVWFAFKWHFCVLHTFQHDPYLQRSSLSFIGHWLFVRHTQSTHSISANKQVAQNGVVHIY